MKKKTLLSEVRQLQKIAGILKENSSANEYAMDIVDMLSSGAGESTGLNTPAFANIVAKIKSEGLIDAVSEVLVDYINSGEGFTEEDIIGLEKFGFNMQGADVGGDDSTMRQIERTIDISDIDFSDDGNRDQIFSVDATDEDIENFENGNVKTVWESDEYGGTFGVYKLPSGEYLYAFPDAEFYAKTPRGIKIL
jgi:hypothetical protein